jgi:hypothetical protein
MGQEKCLVPESASKAGDEPTAAEKITREYMHRFWTGDMQWCKAHADPHAVMIGAQREQYACNRTVFEMIQRAVAGVAGSIILTNEEYKELFCLNGVTVVIGRYFGHVDPRDDMAYANQQRLTFVWATEGDEFRLLHAHVSNPLTDAWEGEAFPVRQSRENARYVQLYSYQKGLQGIRAVQDVGGNEHMIRLFDVLYLHSTTRGTDIHCIDAVIHVQDGIAKAAETLVGDEALGFVRVSRQYMVNSIYVTSMNRSIRMRGGDTIPIPSYRQSEVRRDIRNACFGIEEASAGVGESGVDAGDGASDRDE